ncbi:STN and carboxypeptidase regulatory-like domain-containing protein [Filimonas effusa]|uniref:Secretin/TonB short N-terminal domain-containing protein n=1 Tax=Filimonas effusa TaxID=2508721 RepID=A0A4Q1D1L2_9BACT|nr:STN and carboxypeptidase regulatory-like domain-containing protein [Filimonas effusa]RXK80895.1 hypothetical protein ESB13_22330 [Filimonas effusa]
MSSIKIFKVIVCVLLACACFVAAPAQDLLYKQVSVNVKGARLALVLEQIGKQGDFFFSYNSNVIRGDSLVSLSVRQRTVKQVLDLLFEGSVHYQVSGKYIILQEASPPLSSTWFVSGYVRDAVSGEKISNASVYERQHLSGTITNEDGFFRLRLKDRYKYPPSFAISISRIAYADTFVMVRPGQDELLDVNLQPVSGELSPIILSPKAQRNWLSKLFISSSQSIQSLNLRNFFASEPYQVSLIPGFGTHGKLSSQVVNKASMNVIGGYTAGIDGFEVAGLFNINEKSAKYVQMAGLFNVVGANAEGLQMAGVYNHVQDSVKGWQFSGVNNTVVSALKGLQAGGVYNHVGGNMSGIQIAGVANNNRENTEGFQISGVANMVAGSFKGFQAAGVSNYAGDSASGLQLAGVANVVHSTMNGIQVSFFVNYARHVRGSQIGFINICDSVSGYSIGFINIVKKGYHKLTVSTTDVLDFNLSYKSGNRKLYSIITAGANIGGNRKTYGFGYGFGNETRLTKKLSLINELVFQQLYIGTWDSIPELISYRPAIQWQVNKSVALYTGPCFWAGNTERPLPGYAAVKTPVTIANSGKNRLWMGWHLALQLF